MRIIYIMQKTKKKCNGKHKCCYCPGEAPAYSGASGLWYHMHSCHPNKCKSKRTYKKRKEHPVGKIKKERKKVKKINFSDRDNVNIFNFADNQDYGLEKISDSEVPRDWLSGPTNFTLNESNPIDSKWLDIDTKKDSEGLEQYIDRSRKRLKKTKKKSGGKKKRRKTRRRKKRRKKRRKRN